MQTMLANRVAGAKPFLRRTPAGARRPARSVFTRFQDDKKPGFDTKQETTLTDDQLRELEAKPVGDLSPKNAEMRANLGNAWVDANEVQAFDGPAPETINSRLAMLGVVTGLVAEWQTGLGLRQQVADHPFIVIASFVIIAIASYAPIAKGYTRKEPFATGIWTPKAENWNGRVAMMGFLGMVLTEAITHVNTLQAYGLQSITH
jgi:hypothetical protein